MKYETEYGTVTVAVGGYFRGGSRSWLRRDYYQGHGESGPMLVTCTGPDDISPKHDGLSRTMGGRYDPDCVSCWLGHAHSEAYHAAAIAQHMESA